MTTDDLRRHTSQARLYTTQVYPYKSSTGSTITLSGTDNGLNIAWRGGSPLYFTSSSEGPINGHHAADNHDDVTQNAESDDEALFESDEEEIDDDQPYPSVVQDLFIPFKSPVLHLAVPEACPQDHVHNGPSIFKTCITVAVACPDGTLSVLTIPLDPPSAATKRKRKLGVRQCHLKSEHEMGLIRQIVIAHTDSTDQSTELDQDTAHKPRTRSRASKPAAAKHADHAIFVACATSYAHNTLELFHVPCFDENDRFIMDTGGARAYETLQLNGMVQTLRLPPALPFNLDHVQILVALRNGHLQIHSNAGQSTNESGYKALQVIESFDSSFTHNTSDGRDGDIHAHRKRILDARWVLGRAAILTLLEDGEWGVWIVDAATLHVPGMSKSSPFDFVTRGFVGDALNDNSTGTKSKSKYQLAPVTPNTRRVRQEDLFTGPAPKTGVAPRGGICVTPLSLSPDQDDTVVLWYGNDIYTVPSLRALLSRSMSSKGKDTGTLYKPCLSHLTGIDLCGETIEHVAHLKDSNASTRNAADDYDILITTEHRMIIVANAKPQFDARLLQPQAVESPTHRRDQMLLDQGDLDIGNVDRMLDDMAGAKSRPLSLWNAKRVGFAA